jgi:RNA polymerase sigma-70 factor (ECF subfamily)
MIEDYTILLKQLERDEDRAYATLYTLFYVPLMLFSHKYVNDEEIAKDLVQDVFISMLGRKKNFSDMIALKGYLYHSARNACLNHLRHERIKGRFENRALREKEHVEAFQEYLIEEEVHARLASAIDRLPGQYRAVMRYTLEGRKISEIAREMNITLDTAKEYKKEGKKRLVIDLRAFRDLVSFILFL